MRGERVGDCGVMEALLLVREPQEVLGVLQREVLVPLLPRAPTIPLILPSARTWRPPVRALTSWPLMLPTRLSGCLVSLGQCSLASPIRRATSPQMLRLEVRDRLRVAPMVRHRYRRRARMRHRVGRLRASDLAQAFAVVLERKRASCGAEVTLVG